MSLLLLGLLSFATQGVFAQAAKPGAEQKAELIPARVVQEKLKEWVKTKQLISREGADWESEKATLSDLNEIRQSEIKQLAEFIKVAGERVSEITEQRKKYADEESELKAWRANLESQITKLENQLRPLFSRFPEPLRSGVSEAIAQIEEPDTNKDRPLQHRTRDVLLILQAYLAFHETLTLDTEIRVVGGSERAVNVLYLGLTQAWYVDQSGKFSGSGVPKAKGWVWTEDASIAGRVRRAIDIQLRLEAPAFVDLPIQNGKGAAAK
ncbi:DUF3450 domain-containing protein [Verrucomicrobiales bacterium]|nr:DUF3450 domain-containing protein [Verrucomicrobiales bacterium]MDC0311722.1 DUF3450 domain-containing protein [bacterium]